MANFLRRFFPAPIPRPDAETAAPIAAEPKLLPVLMVTVLDVPEAEHGEIIDKIVAKFGARYRLVFVTTSDDFTPFLARRVAIEYLMPHDLQDRHADLMDWAGYLAEKWALLKLKWQPDEIVAYGMTADRFLNLAHRRP